MTCIRVNTSPTLGGKGSVVTPPRRALTMSFGLMVVAAAVAATATSAAAAPTPVAEPDPAVVAAESSASLVASQPAYLFASAGESFIQGKVISSAGNQYVPYERTY